MSGWVVRLGFMGQVIRDPWFELGGGGGVMDPRGSVIADCLVLIETD